MSRSASLSALFVLVVSGGSSPVFGQGPTIRSELRVDAVAAAHTAIEGGVGVIVPAGIYVRNTLLAATGLMSRNGEMASASRVEMTSRFLLDPFHEAPYGLSVGAGLGATNEARGTRWRPYLALVVDLELKRTSGWTPAVQVGLGGGARFGIALRSASNRWR